MTTPTAPTRSRSRRRSARCCASTRMARFLPTIRSLARLPASIRPSGHAGCAIRSISPSTGPMAASMSTTWARTPGKRSTTAIAGANFGWPQTEGNNPPGVAGVRYPIHAYQNAGTSARSPARHSIGPPPPRFPAEYAGRYFFGDFCGGFIRMLSPPELHDLGGFRDRHQLAGRHPGPSRRFALLPRARRRRSVSRAVHGATPRRASRRSRRASRSPPDSPPSFTVTASGTAPLQYQWQRNGVNIANATSPTYTLTAARRRQRRDVPRGREQYRWLGDQQLRDADGAEQ